MRLKATFLSSVRSKRGSFLLEAMISTLIIASVLAGSLAIVQTRTQTLHDMTNLADSGSVVQSELTRFLYGAEDFSDSNSAVLTSPLTGDSLIALKKTQTDSELGLKFHSIVVYAKPKVFALGGAARPEQSSSTEWRPMNDETPVATSNHILTLKSSALVRGSVSGSGIYPWGSRVPISAKPNPGRTFLRWEGTGRLENPNSASTFVIIDDDTNLTAIFAP